MATAQGQAQPRPGSASGAHILVSTYERKSIPLMAKFLNAAQVRVSYGEVFQYIKYLEKRIIELEAEVEGRREASARRTQLDTQRYLANGLG